MFTDSQARVNARFAFKAKTDTSCIDTEISRRFITPTSDLLYPSPYFLNTEVAPIGTSTSPAPVVPTTIDPSVTTGTSTAGVSTATLTAYVKSYGGNVLAFEDDFGTKYPNMRITAVWGIH